MTKFQRFQKLFSIIPFVSSFFVFIVTMIELKRKNATLKSWVCFFLTFFISGIVVFFLGSFTLEIYNGVLYIVASGLLLAIANAICVDLQIKCTHIEKPVEVQKTNGNPIIWIAGIALIVTLIAVAAIVLVSPSIDIEDMNGGDTHLAVITMDDIIPTNNHYSAAQSYRGEDGAKTDVPRKFRDQDYENVQFGAKKVSGIMTLQATQSDCERLVLSIASTLKAGNMEIVIIIDDEYYGNVPIGSEQTIILDDVKGKLVLVKIAVESAEMSISISRELKTD